MYWATCSNSCCQSWTHSWEFWNLMVPAETVRSADMSAWLPVDTRATQSYWLVPDIAMNQDHPLVPVICIEFGEGRSQGYFDTRLNPKRHSGCCCSYSRSDNRLCSCGVMPCAHTGFPWIAREWKINSERFRSKLSVHWVINIHTVAIPDCICSIHILRVANSHLYVKVGFQTIIVGCYYTYGFNTGGSVQEFELKNETTSSDMVQPMYSGSSVTLISWHQHKVISVGSDRYYMR